MVEMQSVDQQALLDVTLHSQSVVDLRAEIITDRSYYCRGVGQRASEQVEIVMRIRRPVGQENRTLLFLTLMRYEGLIP